MPYKLAGSIAIALYCCAALYQGTRILRNLSFNLLPLQVITAVALVFHGIAAYQRIFAAHGLDLSFFSISVGILFVINLVLFISSFRKPLSSLYLPMYGLSILGLGSSLLADPHPASYTKVPLTIASHIISSILAYSLLTIAAIQALLLALQNWMLRHKHLGGGLKRMPPLQVTESLLFEFIWAGFALLSASLITGILFLENIFTQHLAHKMFFSCLGWALYAALLWGHHARGWRGNTAVKWTLWSFATLIIGFWGSKLVLEFLVSN